MWLSASLVLALLFALRNLWVACTTAGIPPKVLFISYEFDPIFSGNGVYSRTIMKALLEKAMPSAKIMVLCGEPPASIAPGRGNGSRDPLFSSFASRLTVQTIPLLKWGDTRTRTHAR